MDSPSSEFMRTALRLARRGLGKTSPNPAVGAVLVREGRVVGTGWHRAAGLPHAEILAIREAGARAKGADLYVTLEPCSHHGKTGPCVEAILEAGIRRVTAAMEDPNPLVSGRGIARLIEAGVETSVGLLREEAHSLNEAWIRWITGGRPFVTLKLAISLDGQIAGSTGDSRWVSGEASRNAVHRMRSRTDAVLVGGETARRDDPLLTCRIRGGKDPLRVVVTSGLDGLEGLRMFSEGADRNIVLAPEGTDHDGAARLRRAGAAILFPRSREGKIDAHSALELLGKRGVVSLLVEGGGHVAGWLLGAGVVDRIVLFVAPLLLGEGVRSVSGWSAGTPGEGRKFALTAVRRKGSDLMIVAEPQVVVPGRKACSPV